MSRLENLQTLKITNSYHSWTASSHCDIIDVMFDKPMTISAVITAKSYFNERTNLWLTLCRYKDLERLDFRIPFKDFDKSMPNIEPLIKLKEITFECFTKSKYFFDNITKLAPNVEELELKFNDDNEESNVKLMKYNITVLPRKERHAGISEGDHFHKNGLMVLYRHAGINRGMLFPEIFALFLTLPISFKYE